MDQDDLHLNEYGIMEQDIIFVDYINEVFHYSVNSILNSWRIGFDSEFKH